MVYDTQPACKTCPASFPKYNDWKTRNQVFAEIGGVMPARFVLTGSGEPIRMTGAATTASLAAVIGVPPRIGRWYSDEEDQPGGRKVVVLSHAWLDADHHGADDGGGGDAHRRHGSWAV